MFEKTKILKFFSVCALLIMVGCSSTPSIDDMVVRMRDTDEVKILDMRSIVANGMLRVDVTVHVKSTKKNVSYRMLWLDKNKFQVYGAEAWKPLTIGSGQTGVIHAVAPGPNATDFKFELTSD
jgi:uncharacterized protein YcfL